MAAPLFYLGGLALGTFNTPGYNPLQQAVSELIADGARWKPIIDIVFSVCGLMVLLSSLGLQRLMEGSKNHIPDLAGRLGSWTLAGISLLGLVILAFPMDSPGSLHSPAGLVHTICSCLMCAVSLPAVIFVTYWLYSKPGFGGLARYSAVTAVILFAAGSAAALVYFSNRAFLGLLERLTFIAFFQWLTVLSFHLSQSLRVGVEAGEQEIYSISVRREKFPWML